MGGIDKSDMLTHLYKSPMKAKRWYLRLFDYIQDVCTTNRDCEALKEAPHAPQKLKYFHNIYVKVMLIEEINLSFVILYV